VINKRLQNSTASYEFVFVKSSVYNRQFLLSGVIIAKKPRQSTNRIVFPMA